MKTFYAMAALAAFNLAAAQKTTEFKEIKSITAGADIKLTLVRSDQNKLVADGSDGHLQIMNVGGALVLNGDSGKITLYYKDALESITAASDAEISGIDEIRSKELAITAAADAKINLIINVEKLHTTAASDAGVTLSGKATDHDAKLASDAELHALGLLTQNTNIALSSDASATITATGIVNAAVLSDGSLKIHGNPKKVNQTKGGDAQIVVVK